MADIEVILFESPCKKAKIYVEKDMPIGVFHDFLMFMKGNMIDRMVAAQKAEMEQSKAMQAEQPNLPVEDDCCKKAAACTG